MFRSKYVLVLLTIIIWGCGNKSNTSNFPVSALTTSQQNLVNQSLKNGVIPTPREVLTNTITTPVDACTKFREEIIPKNWFQNKIEVPEDPSQPEGKKINIFYYGFIKGGVVPTVFFNGGPSLDSHNSYSTMTNAQNFFDQERNTSFIFIDQRGTGCSDYYPQGNSEDILERLRFYGTRGIVSDAEFVRKKVIGDKKWNVFGQSYGSFIVHRYSILTPNSINASFAHANTINTDGLERLTNRIKSQVRVMNDFLNQYPDDLAKLQTLKSALTINKCFVSEKFINQKACGNRPLELIAAKLLGFSNQWIKIHQWIGIMVKENQIDENGIGKFLAAFYFGESNPLNSSGTAGKVIDWVDRGIPEMDTFTCIKVKDRLLDQGIDLDLSLSNECMKSLQVSNNANVNDTSLSVQNLKQDLMTIEELKSTLKDNPQLPFYIYSAQKDGYVPLENFAEEINVITELKNVHYTHFKSTGHDEFFLEPQSWEELLDNSKQN